MLGIKRLLDSEVALLTIKAITQIEMIARALWVEIERGWSCWSVGMMMSLALRLSGWSLAGRGGWSTRVVGVALVLGLSNKSIVVDEWLFLGLLALLDLGKLEGVDWSEEEDRFDDGSNPSTS